MIHSSALWKPLFWDTSFFGVKTARIMTTRLNHENLPSIMAEIDMWGAQVVHFLADADDDQTVQIAEQAGFHLVDIRITFACDLRKTLIGECKSDVAVRLCRDEDIPMLQLIARNSYRQTRYYYDKHYAQERCDALYETWITESYNDDSQKVVVAEHQGKAIGFITYKNVAPEETSIIGLVGVHEYKRGMGIGRLLLQATQHDLIGRRVSTLEVVTQGRNIDAQRLYQRCGFVTKTINLWYHKWM